MHTVRPNSLQRAPAQPWRRALLVLPFRVRLVGVRNSLFLVLLAVSSLCLVGIPPLWLLLLPLCLGLALSGVLLMVRSPRIRLLERSHARPVTADLIHRAAAESGLRQAVTDRWRSRQRSPNEVQALAHEQFQHRFAAQGKWVAITGVAAAALFVTAFTAAYEEAAGTDKAAPE